MFGRATITLGIGPHSSFISFIVFYCNLCVCFIVLRLSLFFVRPFRGE